MTDTALDLFRGAGGWSVACDRLGIDETGVEFMPEANATASAAGFKSHDVNDVWDIDYALLRGIYDGEIASPPCQTFSLAGKGAGRKALDQVLNMIAAGVYKQKTDLREVALELGDLRTALVLLPLHAAWEMRPRWIAWEQVPTVLPVWEACAEELRSWGYSVWTGNLQAEQYGVPQTRKRAFLGANLEEDVAPPVPTHSKYYARSPEKLDPGVLKWISMAEALAAGGVSLPGECMRSNYGTGGDASKRGERLASEPAPTVTSKIDRNKWVYRSTTMANSARRPIDCPAPTIAFGHDAGSAQWIPVAANEGDTVRVTVQEAGILQSFPADHPWQGAKTKQYLQVGNAVPPLLAEAVLRSVVL